MPAAGVSAEAWQPPALADAAARGHRTPMFHPTPFTFQRESLYQHPAQ
jgi:hypothetical protein